MIKRDWIQRVRIVPADDEQGGTPVSSIEPFEMIKANCSVIATGEQITQYGITTQKLINVVSDVKLDDYVLTRYRFNGDYFRLLNQVKRGNEWFSVLMETVEEEVAEDD